MEYLITLANKSEFSSFLDEKLATKTCHWKLTSSIVPHSFFFSCFPHWDSKLSIWKSNKVLDKHFWYYFLAVEFFDSRLSSHWRGFLVITVVLCYFFNKSRKMKKKNFFVVVTNALNTFWLFQNNVEIIQLWTYSQFKFSIVLLVTETHVWSHCSDCCYTG